MVKLSINRQETLIISVLASDLCNFPWMDALSNNGKKMYIEAFTYSLVPTTLSLDSSRIHRQTNKKPKAPHQKPNKIAPKQNR